MSINLRGLGPLLLTDAGRLVSNPNGLDTNLLFLDFWGAGYSRPPNDDQLTPQQVAAYAVEQLQAIFAKLPQLKSKKLTLIGTNLGAKVATFSA